MKFTVTPLGGSRNDVGRVVAGIVRYLQPKPAPGLSPPPHPQGGGERPSRYYADSSEEPGRWLGRAAELANLRGDVDRDDFTAVLSGRDPRTNARRISAQGSAGRRADLGAGTHTRIGLEGHLLYDEADAATALSVTKTEAARMFDAGAALNGAQDPGAPAEGRADSRAGGRADGRVSPSGLVRAS